MRIPGSKTAVPELPLEHIPRVALLGQLDRAAAGQIVVVSAPPGYGKTLLLAEWVRRSGGPGAAWGSLDRDDDDPRRFWAAVLAALRGVPGLPPDSALHRVGTAAVADGGDLVDELAEALDVLDPPVRLVLDDVHEVTAREPLRDLARLVRRRPRGLRLVLSSRVDPPLSLPRLRLEGRLHELRADRLRFGVDDAAVLLRATGLDLTSAQVDLLHRRTDGWVAGLRLAALALRRSDDTDAFLAHFSGDERSVAEYLTGEVLSSMPRDAHDLLRAVSVCSRLPAELAVELTGRPDAGVLLEDLGHETAMVERTAHGGHRLHALLRSYLVANLKHRRPAAHRRLQVTAARWWADRGEAAHALRHAERAGDSALLAELLRRSGVLLLLNGELAPLRRSLAVVGPAGRAADPWLALIAAITHLGERELPAAAAELAHARRAWPATPDPSLDALRTSAELLAAGMGLPVVAQPETTTGPGSSGPEMVALLHVSRGAAGLAAGADGFDAARTELELALELARRNDLAFLEVQSLSLLAMLAGVQGDHRGMVAAAEDAVAAAARCGRHPSAWSAGASAMLAYPELLAGDPSAARARAAGSLDTADPLPPEAAYTLHVVHGTALA
ncbi:MAG: hypothetical protein L0I24_19540, partial [Pseudonocardia sp.]|nr:hypothetical protein [Pseudonocardia sp.]